MARKKLTKEKVRAFLNGEIKPKEPLHKTNKHKKKNPTSGMVFRGKRSTKMMLEVMPWAWRR